MSLKCAKDTGISIGIVFVVITITSGVMFDQINRVEAEVDKRTLFVYSIPSIQEDISEIKSDVKDIKGFLQHQQLNNLEYKYVFNEIP